MKIHRKLIASTFALVAGCATDEVETVDTTQASMSGLQFEVANGEDVIGTFNSQDLLVRFSSHTEWGNRVTARFGVGATRLDVIYDAHGGGDLGSMTVSVSGELDARQRGVLRDMTYSLARVFPTEVDASQPSGALVRTYAGLFSEWTIGPTVRPRIDVLARPTLQIDPEHPPGGGEPYQPPAPIGGSALPPPICGQVSDNDLVQIMPECCNGGVPHQWQHDFTNECFTTAINWCGWFSQISTDPLATECPGRCGPGCAAYPLYTQDCLDHDLCLMHHPGLDSTGTAHGCGDEFVDGIDDVALIYGMTLLWGPIFWDLNYCVN